MPGRDLGERKLAAIMFTDMVGFTALAQRDEALALELLETHRELLRPVFVRFGGREIKTLGDGFLVVFASALDATRCAIAIQTAFVDYDTSASSERRMQVRIGLHLGDVVQRDGDVVGDGVNIASRLEKLAAPGGICLSRPVFDQVGNKLDLPLMPAGTPYLKNIQTPTEVYKVVLPWEPGATSAPPPHPRVPHRVGAWAGGVSVIVALTMAWWLGFRSNGQQSLGPSAPADLPRSIAVLPFVNTSPDKDNEYLSDGISEEIIGVLSKINGLRVAARTSSFAFKGRDDDIGQIGQRLHVASVLEGSVRRAGDRLRITAELVDVASGYHLWSDTYDQGIADIFAIQTDVAERVAAALKVELGVGVKQRIHKRSTDNVEAYQLYLKGRYYTSRLTADGFGKAIGFFQEAIALDPGYALPYSGLALYYIFASDAPLPPRESMPKAKEAAERALALDDDLAEAHAYLGSVHSVYEWNAAAADREFKRAIASDENCAIAHALYGFFLIGLGHLDDGLTENRRAVELDPLSPEVNTFLGLGLYLARRYDQAIAQLRQTMDIDPGYWWGRVVLGRAYLMRGDVDDGVRELELAQRRADMVAAESQWTLGWGYAVAGRRDQANAVLDATIRQRSGREFISAYGIAVIEAGIGDPDRAFEWFEKAYEDRAMYLTLLRVDPAVDGLRSDPRFAALVDKVGFGR
jgi:TolB-like protein/class 3 adenylate cyclase/Flp pilus assembly protein TadD